MMKIDPLKTFVTSDHHFDSIKLPFLHVFTPEQEEKLIEKWNSTVNSDDIVLYNGDFCDGDEKSVLNFKSRLNGRIMLIKGNHDKLSDDFYREVFDAVLDRLILEEFNVVIQHKPKDCSMNQIYGHMHRGYVVGPLDKSSNFCSCVQAHDGFPVRLDEVLKSFTQQICQADC